MIRKRGSTLTFVVAGVVILLLIGIFFFSLTKLFTGSKEAVNATDAGSLSLAKEALNEPSIKLKDGEEKETFGRSLDENGKVTLRSYNRIVASAMVIGLNAQKLGTSEALQHAQQALALAQSGSDSIGSRLQAKLQDAKSHQAAFEKIAKLNSVRMVGEKSTDEFQGDQFAVSYMDRNAGANVFVPKGVNYKIPSSSISSDSDSSGNKYLKGYSQIELGQSLKYMFVPIRPEQSPHLVSSKDFDGAKTSPLPGKIPCNSFKSVAIATGDNKEAVGASSYSIVGAMDSKFALEHSGYLKIVNPKGYPGQNYNAVKSIYTDELMNGIYLIKDKQGKTVAFSTDPTIANQWKAFNENPGSTRPETNDQSGNPVVFDMQGMQATPALLSQIAGPTGPSAGCNVTNVGLHGNNECINMIPSFYNAYPAHDDTEDSIEGNKQYTTIQQASWDLARTLHLISGPGGHNAAGKREVGAFLRAPRDYTGQVKFDHNANYYYNNLFTLPNATISELCRQVGNGAESVIEELKERIREIKPDVSNADLDRLINQTPLPLGTTLYIYKDKKDKLMIGAEAPEGVAASVAADGREKLFQVTYQTIFKSVDPPFRAGDYRKPWLLPPPADQVAVATDQVIWTPSSGYRGLLGVLEFRNYLKGDGWFYWAN